MPQARRHQISLENARFYYCVSRCVRRAFLCGFDQFLGKSFDHRKEWMVEAFQRLAGIFAIRICAYVVMSNHYHLVLYVDAESAASWSDREVCRRWGQLFMAGRGVVVPAEGEPDPELRATIEEWRNRLADISWFMGYLNEGIARKASKEDECTGRFWEGRFKSQALVDETALLACMAYVDLNPVRSGMSETPEASDFTSIKDRIDVYAKRATPNASLREQGLMQFSQIPTGTKIEAKRDLKPLEENTRPQFEIPATLEEYLELIDWTGKTIKVGHRGEIPANLAPILDRLCVDSKGWLGSTTTFEKRFFSAAGKLPNLKNWSEKIGTKWVKGMSSAKELFTVSIQKAISLE